MIPYPWFIDPRYTAPTPAGLRSIPPISASLSSLPQVSPLPRPNLRRGFPNRENGSPRTCPSYKDASNTWKALLKTDCSHPTNHPAKLPFPGRNIFSLRGLVAWSYQTRLQVKHIKPVFTSGPKPDTKSWERVRLPWLLVAM